MHSLEEQALELARHMDNLGALDVRVLDISQHSDWASYILIASFDGSGRKGLGFLAEACTMMRDFGADVRVADQSPENFWFVCDAGDIIIHLFKEEMRDYYSLEKLWHQARVVYPMP